MMGLRPHVRSQRAIVDLGGGGGGVGEVGGVGAERSGAWALLQSRAGDAIV